MFTLAAQPHVAIVKPVGKSVNLVQGDNLELVCEYWGYPEPTVVWERVGGDGDGMLNSSRISRNADGVQRAHMNITSVQLSDYALYKCVAVNSNSSASIKVRVKGEDKLFISICY